METDPAKRVTALLRGLSNGDVEMVRSNWRALRAAGPSAVHAVRAKLHSPAWGSAPKGPGASYLSMLLVLLDELDRQAFAEEIERLGAAQLHPAHRQTVALIGRRREDRPVARIEGVPVHVAPEIADRRFVARCLARWARTPGVELAEVTWIDVIARTPGMEYLGRYSLFFSGIILTWPRDRTFGPKRWFWRLTVEHSFYHELGHHALGHLEGGSILEQEQEADHHAKALMRRAHPILTTVARALLIPLRPLVRPLGAETEPARPETVAR